MSSILVQVIVGGLLLGAVYALFSSGLTLVWGMMNIVNFAHGDFVMLGMYFAFMVWTLFGAGPWLGAPLAALALATLGVVVYFGLIRDIMKGPMLAQILGTFGLALLLTRTSLGSKMLAVAEDSTAAQLMGILPDTMQAIAWAIAAGATGLAGALIATFFYIVPTVGETLAIVAFVTVSLGGFGSVPGALVAGLLIGVIESLSAYLIGAVYKDMVVYALFLGFLWFRPQGLMGKMLCGACCGVRWCWRFSSPIRCCSRRRFNSGSVRWCCCMRSRHRPGTSSAAMPARCRSATWCSSAVAPMPRWAHMRISDCRHWSEFPPASSSA